MHIPSLTATAVAAAAERLFWPDRARHRIAASVAVAAFLTALVLVANPGSASAHSWAGWHWDRGGSYVPVNIWNYAGTSTIAEAARADIHRRPHPVYLLNASYHTDVSVFDAYEPGANYCGLAEIVNWYWSPPWQYHISHAHARYNTACGGAGGSLPNYAQGVYCQEIGHTLGLDHSDTGDCMGLGYFAGSNGRYCFGVSCTSTTPSHPSDDLYSMYRFH
jgi:hypothetical protein